MTQAADLRRAFELEIGKVKQIERNALVSAAVTTYKAIMRDWPVYTGYSKAGNRVSITGRDINTRLGEKDNLVRRSGIAWRKKPLATLAKDVERTELAKLKKLRTERGTVRHIVIGNSVEYAADVRFQTGEGIAIYTRAALEAELGTGVIGDDLMDILGQ